MKCCKVKINKRIRIKALKRLIKRLKVKVYGDPDTFWRLTHQGGWEQEALANYWEDRLYDLIHE